MTILRMQHLAALTDHQHAILVERLSNPRRIGRPWSQCLRLRILIACTALRTNLTFRELAAVFRISKSTAHRIVASMIAELARLPPHVQTGAHRGLSMGPSFRPETTTEPRNRRTTEGRAMHRFWSEAVT